MAQSVKGSKEASENPGDFRIYLRDVRHGYGKKLVLGNVDLAVRAGEFVTLAGPSGCGKSTLLRLILGEEQPQEGLVRIDDKPRMRPDNDCGIVYQKYSVFPHFTVLENIIIGPIFSKTRMDERLLRLGSWRKVQEEAIEEARSLLSIMGLEEAEKKYPHQLSGGMQQRVAIAQAVIMHPKVLLLDEPFSALDPWTREQLQDFILQLWVKERMTIIFVTHDLEEAIFLGTRIVVLSQQYVTANGGARGARIVADLLIQEKHPRPVEFKTSATLNKILDRIRRIAFEKKEDGELVPLEGFLLDHPDSFHTAPGEEWRR